MNTKILTPSQCGEAAEIIRAGGLVAFPTETVYGLGGNALNPEAASKIYTAKGRPSDNPLIIHLADLSWVEHYCYPCELFWKLAEAFMPGPLTVIMPKRDNIPGTVTAGLDSVAVRIPSDPVAHELIRLAGVPIAAPSANLSGSPSPTTARHVIADLDGRVDAIIAGSDCMVGLESTVVKLEGESLRLLRPGAVTIELLRGICPDAVIDPAVLGKFDPSAGAPASPGMKYRHYAPSSPVTLLDGTDEEVYAFLADKDDAHNAVLCYDEDSCLLKRRNSLSMGSRSDAAEQAHRLFACLRDFSHVDMIYSRLPSADGIGLAVVNRLIRAAGYTVLHLPDRIVSSDLS